MGSLMHKSRKSLTFDLAVLVGSLAVLGYFGWHGFYGPRSFDFEKVVAAKLKIQQEKLAELEDMRDTRNARVALLRARTIDPDMLDEVSRRVLEFSKTDEITIFYPTK